MKKEIMNTLQVLGLNPRYQGSTKTFYVNYAPEQLIVDTIEMAGFNILIHI